MKYRINICGYERTLAFGAEEIASDGYVLIPSDVGYEYSIAREAGNSADSELVSSLISAFFGSFRGYPEMTLDVLCDGRVMGVDICPFTYGHVKLNVGKCRKIVRDSVDMPDLVTLFLTTVYGIKGKIRVAECRNVSTFSVSVLDSLRVVGDLPSADASFALFLAHPSAEVVGAGNVPFSSFLLLLSYLSSLGVRRVSYSGCFLEIGEDGKVYLPFELSSLS